MGSFTDDISVIGTTESTIIGPTGSMGFSPALSHEVVGNGWNTWSNGYSGDVYETTGEAIKLSLPKKTEAFYFYAEPDEYSPFTVTATNSDGTTSGSVQVNGESGAQYFGFYTSSASYLKSIQVTTSDSEGFAIGEFGINVHELNILPTLSVSMTGNPSSSASIDVAAQITDASNNPVSGATVSSTAPKGTTKSDLLGDATFVEPITLEQASATTTINAKVGGISATPVTQALYSDSQVTSCEFEGEPGIDISDLEGLVGNPYASAFLDILDAVVDYKQSKFQTWVNEYTISIPNHSNLYAATFTVTNLSTNKIKKSYTLFGTAPVFTPPTGIDALFVSCGGIA